MSVSAISMAAYATATTLPAVAAPKPKFRTARTPSAPSTSPRGAQHPPMSSMLTFRPPPLTPTYYIQSRRPYTTSAPPPTPRVPGTPVRPGTNYGGGYKDVPPPKMSYKSAERKVRVAIIALPVAIVTSWVLYNRLMLGEERKVLVRPEQLAAAKKKLAELE